MAICIFIIFHVFRRYISQLLLLNVFVMLQMRWLDCGVEDADLKFCNILYMKVNMLIFKQNRRNCEKNTLNGIFPYKVVLYIMFIFTIFVKFPTRTCGII